MSTSSESVGGLEATEYFGIMDPAGAIVIVTRILPQTDAEGYPSGFARLAM
jgi:hypothetical protein